MTEKKEFCKFYQKGRKCSLKQDDFRCIENLGGNCASYRYYAFELEQENKELKEEKQSIKSYLGIESKTILERLEELDEWKHNDKLLLWKYRSALEEIRILATKNVSIENFVKIQNRINEVLNDN